MKFKLFLDSTVFIYSFERPHSNSKKIIDLLNENKVVAVTSTRVLKEVIKYFEHFYSLELAKKFRKYIINSSIVIPETLVNRFYA
jgi:predicted nucleic acid-binding protein